MISIWFIEGNSHHNDLSHQNNSWLHSIREREVTGGARWVETHCNHVLCMWWSSTPNFSKGLKSQYNLTLEGSLDKMANLNLRRERQAYSGFQCSLHLLFETPNLNLRVHLSNSNNHILMTQVKTKLSILKYQNRIYYLNDLIQLIHSSLQNHNPKNDFLVAQSHVLIFWWLNPCHPHSDDSTL